jgi:hypothetical protein
VLSRDMIAVERKRMKGIKNKVTDKEKRKS